MDLMALSASITLDSSGFLRGIDEAHRAFEGLSDSIREGLVPDGGFPGNELADNIQSGVSRAAAFGKAALEKSLGGAGAGAGRSIADGIQSALSGRTFRITVTGTWGGISGGPVPEKNASAMADGRIFTKATVFGFANGAYQAAGDAGAEAVVGVGSLNRMIRESVSASLGGSAAEILAALREILAELPKPRRVSIDSNRLAGTLGRQMNARLGDLASWRESGRA